MIKQFGYYDPSIKYKNRDGSYLLFVDLSFRFLVVKSDEGYFLIGGGIETKEDAIECLKREVKEEIGAEINGTTLVCETITYYSLDEGNKMYQSHNYFYYAENISFYKKTDEPLELLKLTFSEAIAKLTLEHQRWAVLYFREHISKYTNNPLIMDSINFINGLNTNDLQLIRSVPKSDLHNHAVFGSSKDIFYKYTGVQVPEIKKPFINFEEFCRWCDSHISNQFRNKEGFISRIATALISAEDDGIQKLCFNIAVCAMKFFDSADELIETIETLRHKYYHGSTFIPELCLDREKIRDSRYLDWYYQLLDTCYFQSIDLTGNELISTDLAVPLYREAEKKGLILKAHFAESYFSDNNLIDIKNLHLNEIQHGNMLIDDENAIKYLKENNIQLNICPSSNYFLSNVKSLTQHPIGKLYQKNIRVTINSDDQLIFGSNVSNEYLNLFKNKVLNPEELNQIRLIGLGVL